jgi:O-antigen/teichoic acid export membrane protein
MSRQFINDFIKYIPSSILPGIISFISIPIITRIFSTAEYGMYSLIMSAIFSCLVIMSWLPVSITRFYPKYENNNQLDLFKWNVICYLFFEILILLSLFFILFLKFKSKLQDRQTEIFISAYFLFLGFCVFEVFQYVLRALRKVNTYSLFASLRSVFSVSIGLAMILCFHYRIHAFFYSGIIAFLILIPWQWKQAFGKELKFFSEVDLNLLKEMVRYGFPVILTNLSIWVLTFSDRYIIQLFHGPGSVGLYAANYNIVEFSITQAVNLFMLACGPLAIRVWEKEGIEGSRIFLTNTTSYLLMLGIPMIAGLSVLSRPISVLIIGNKFAAGHSIIPFVAFGILFYWLEHQYSLVFQFFKKTIYSTYSTMMAGILNIILNFIFVPKYGYFAAAVTTAISYIFMFSYMLIVSRKHLQWKFPLVSLLKVITATGIMIFFVVITNKNIQAPAGINLLTSISVGIIIYSFSLFLLEGFNKNTKEMIRSLLKISGNK